MRVNTGASPSYRTWLLWRPLWQQRRQQGRLLGERGRVRGSDGLQWPCQCLLASTTADIPEHPLESISPGTRPGTPTPGTPTPGTPTPGTPTPGTPTPGTPTPGTPTPGTPTPGMPAPGTPAPVTPTLITPTLSTPAPGRYPAPAERTRDAAEPHAQAICISPPSLPPSQHKGRRSLTKCGRFRCSLRCGSSCWATHCGDRRKGVRGSGEASTTLSPCVPSPSAHLRHQAPRQGRLPRQGHQARRGHQPHRGHQARRQYQEHRHREHQRRLLQTARGENLEWLSRGTRKEVCPCHHAMGGSTPCLIPAGGWDTRLVLGHPRGWEVTSMGDDATVGSR